MPSYSDLHDYQQEAIEWMTNRQNGMLWLKMGDGKTVVAASAIISRAVPALVVGTKRIVENVWPEELKKWDHLTGLTYRSASGSKAKRISAIEARPDVLGVSYENLVWLIACGYHRRRPVVVFDEISKMKSHATKRFRAVMRAGKPDAAFGLTATPAVEGYGGLFSQWRSIGGDERLGRNITEFRKLFATPIFKGAFTDYYIPSAAQDRIRKLLSPEVFTIEDSRRPYRGSPTIIDVHIPWGSIGAQRKYAQMEKELIAVLATKTFAVASKGVAMNKCRQLATGFIYDEDKTAHPVDVEKLDAVAEAVEELQGDPVLVFYQFEYERDELLRRIPGAQTLEGHNYELFNEGKIPALVLHPQSCSHGLNLQGARYAFYSSLPQSGEQYIQSIGRVDRQGQERQPIIKRFLREGSVDGDIADLLAGKILSDEELVRRIQERA